ncbi:MAG TPA: hydrogenase nickel incorporation protein HypB [Pseudonocardia sp.]|nr:hydrogenase nickel incorporation protein HypB [Pseudonocardia sp.]
MCATCGCSEASAGVRVIDPAGHDHAHDHPHPHDHSHDHPRPHDHPHAVPHAPADRPRGHTISLEQAVLAKNDGLAAVNRRWLAERGILALNLMSSPGAGKTTLLERTIADLAGELPVSVVEGDQETLLDAQRISDTGCRVVQINTGSGCHLDAEMVDRGLRTLAPESDSVLFIENVGNLVCPALFDLGETAKVVITSTTEGEDKPLKYPQMFAAADLVLLNKVDLLPYLSFDVDRCLAGVRRVNPRAEILLVSATRGEGLPAWYDWLRGRVGSRMG